MRPLLHSSRGRRGVAPPHVEPTSKQAVHLREDLALNAAGPQQSFASAAVRGIDPDVLLEQVDGDVLRAARFDAPLSVVAEMMTRALDPSERFSWIGTE